MSGTKFNHTFCFIDRPKCSLYSDIESGTGPSEPAADPGPGPVDESDQEDHSSTDETSDEEMDIDDGSEDEGDAQSFRAEIAEVSILRDSPASPHDDQPHISLPENRELTADVHVFSPPRISSNHQPPSTSSCTPLLIAHSDPLPQGVPGAQSSGKCRNQDDNEGGCVDSDCDDPEAAGDFVSCDGCAHRVSVSAGGSRHLC